MKRLVKVLAVSVAVFCMSNSVFAANNNVNVAINGKVVTFDVNPQIINGRTMVPLRGIFENLGANVDFDSKDKTISGKLDEKRYVNMQIGSKKANIAGKEIELDTPPTIIEGRTLVPAYVVANGLGCDVNWDGDTKTVYINSKEDSQEDILNDSDNSKSDLPDVTSINLYLDGDKTEVVKNQVIEVKASIHPREVTKKDLTWYTSDSNVLRYNKPGKFTAIGCGTATVLVVAPNGYTASMEIRVMDMDEYLNSIDPKNNSKNVSYGNKTSNITNSKNNSNSNNSLINSYKQQIRDLNMQLAKIKSDTSYMVFDNNGKLVNTYDKEKARDIERQIETLQKKVDALSSNNVNAIIKAEYESELEELEYQKIKVMANQSYLVFDSNGKLVYTYDKQKVKELEQKIYELKQKIAAL